MKKSVCLLVVALILCVLAVSASAAEAASFEGEAMTVTSEKSGAVQSLSHISAQGAWSGNAQYWWKATAVGDSASFTFSVDEEVSGTLKISLTKAKNYGTVQLYLDGRALGEAVDCYHAHTVPGGVITRGGITLTPGEHTVTAVVVGKNEASSGYYFGLDRLFVDSASGEATVIEGEDMELLRAGCGLPMVQTVNSSTAFSGNRQLWWSQSSVTAAHKLTANTALELYFDLPENFAGDLRIAYCKASDYGKFRIYVDGTALGGVQDAYSETLTHSGRILLGQTELAAGRHILKIQNVGKNDAASSYMFGLDCLYFYENTTEKAVVFEGEAMDVTSEKSGAVQALTAYNDNGAWSGNAHYWWKATAVGNSAEFSFTLDETVRGNVKIGLTKAKNYGILQFYLDGKALGAPVDGYHAYVCPSGTILRDTMTLEKGTHTLKAVVTGKNSLSSGFYAGIDYFAIDPAPVSDNVFEGENLEIGSISGGIPVVENGMLVWSNDMKKADFAQTENGSAKLLLDLKSAFSGMIRIAYGKAPDYGRFDLYIDGTKIGSEIDAYSETAAHAGIVDLGTAGLAAGRHILELRNIGKNDASNGYAFALDALYLVTDVYTYADIVSMLTDLSSLALLPENGENGGAATSYNRVSYYDAETDSYINWGGDWNSNNDGVGYIRTEETEGKPTGYVVAELEGPGVILRSFSATTREGAIEIYIDGETTPRIEQPFNSFFEPSGIFDGLDNLCYVAAQGKVNYVPIPYNESCKIILREGYGKYYHFTYHTFPKGTTVLESFPTEFSDEQKSALTQVNSELGNPSQKSAAENGTLYSETYVIPAGGSAEVLSLDGEGAVRQFKVKLNGDYRDRVLTHAMQSLTVSMYWDGEASPSVWAPLGDFFATPYGDAYQSLPLGTLEDGTYYCYWYMPYGDGARVVIGNDGETPYSVTVTAETVPLDGDIGEYMRFHAKWSRNEFLPTRADRSGDYTVLVTEGRGRFLGFDLNVNNNKNGWWGEGDEKFFVDGEKFPSTFGTGSEDYFGYAWCDPGYFSKAFHAQNHTTGILYGAGNFNNVRFHIADNIPFQTRFEGCIEKFFSEAGAKYAATAYWYLDADGTDPYSPVTDIETRSFYSRGESMFEGEALEASSADSGTVQRMIGYSTNGWSGGGQYLWKADAVGDTVDFTFYLIKDTTGALQIALTGSAQGGIVSFALDGMALGSAHDCYSEYTVPHGLLDLGQVSLTAGAHTLRITTIGKNPKSSGYHMGLDYFRIDEAKSADKTLEGETLTVLAVTQGIAYPQTVTSLGGIKQLWWNNNYTDETYALSGGGVLRLGFALEKAFSGNMLLTVCKAKDYGIFDFYIDGVKVGGDIDLYSATTKSDTVTLNTTALASGRHILELRNKGTSGTGYLFGLDCIRFLQLSGDADFDGKLSLADVLRTLRAVTGEFADMMHTDMDGDGTISVKDALLILRASLKNME